MRLGIVMLGTGAYAAVNVGVIKALRLRWIEPYAVCGMQTGAAVAAMHLLGMDDREMEEALVFAARGVRKILRGRQSSLGLLTGRKTALLCPDRLERMLCAKAPDRLMGLCERRGIFICRSASSNRRIVFSSKPYSQGPDTALTLQSTVSFACCAAMAKPPFLSPMSWHSSPMIPEENPAYAAKQLFRLGADRVLMIDPRACACHKMDALELSGAQVRWAMEEPMPEGVGILRLMMPADCGALAFSRMQKIAQTGFSAAQAQLDGVLASLGMSMCRVIPFRPRQEEVIRRL